MTVLCFYRVIETQVKVWENEKCFFEFSQTFTTQNLDHQNVKKLILFAHAIIASKACASSVFLSSYRNTVLNQLARIFALGCFLKPYNKNYLYFWEEIGVVFCWKTQQNKPASTQTQITQTRIPLAWSTATILEWNAYHWINPGHHGLKQWISIDVLTYSFPECFNHSWFGYILGIKVPVNRFRFGWYWIQARGEKQKEVALLVFIP